MGWKIAALAIAAVSFVFESCLLWLRVKSTERDIPDNVKDVYDGETYRKWAAYDREKNRLAVARHVVSFAVMVLVLGLDVYAGVVRLLGLEGVYAGAVAVLLADLLIGLVVDTPFQYVDAMVIEEKYGFNRRTKGVFFVDVVKELLLSGALLCAVCCAFILLHQTLGNWLLLAFTGLMVVVLLGVIFIAPALGRINNKFEPLPEGELRRRLMALLEENGCTVKAINVMDGSKRTTKANAYFSGLGRSKTIVLYDTLLEQMTEDEIVAVFAHEMGHNKHRDTLKMYPVSILNVVVMVALAWALVSVPEICRGFGFDGVNYGFAFYLMASVCLPLLSPALNLLSSGLSRRNEYAADRFAVESGYGDALASALKKLSLNSFACLNPHPLLVKLSYSHPTVSQRVAAIQAAEAERK